MCRITKGTPRPAEPPNLGQMKSRVGRRMYVQTKPVGNDLFFKKFNEINTRGPILILQRGSSGNFDPQF